MLPIIGQQVLLRDFRKEDWQAVHEYASQEVVTWYMPWGPNQVKDTKAFVARAMKEANKVNRTVYSLAVELRETECLVGGAHISIEDKFNRKGEIGYVLHPDVWKHGIGTEIAKLLIEFGFNKLALHRIYTTCDPRNVASMRVLEKAGMQREGLLRDDMLLKARWRDSYLYAILDYEYRESCKS
jgi:RimJ/RimL family protein N-acetyltransferase